MKIVKLLLCAVVALPLLAVAVLWIGSAISLDRSGAYSEQAAALPEFDKSAISSSGIGLVNIAANGLQFRARVAGFDNSSTELDRNVILLHGFPESSAMWLPLVEALAQAGYRVVAFDQRGYSPGARPAELSQYVMPQLIGDVMAVAAAAGFERFHLVGHDWGAAVGWATTMAAADRILSWNALSIPHVVAFGDAVANDPDQQSKSAYMGFFAMPWLPERIFAFDDFDMLRNNLYNEHDEQTLAEYLALFAEPGALTGALNWYRAGRPGVGGDGPGSSDLATDIELPVQFIWGNKDAAVSPNAVDMHRKYMKGIYREVELDAGHWLMENEPEVVVDRIVDFIVTNS